MLGKLSGWDDTIVALATPQGVGAIGVVRVSGKEAIDMVNNLFPSKDLSKRASHTLHVGMLQQKGVPLDHVVVSLFKAPASYTGENGEEISSNGSPYFLKKKITKKKKKKKRKKTNREGRTGASRTKKHINPTKGFF